MGKAKKTKAHPPQDAPAGWWRDVPGTDGKYQASKAGEVRHVYSSGMVAELRPFMKSSDRAKQILRNRLHVRLSVGGRVKEMQVLRVMVQTFYGGAPAGMVAYHKNGMATDNRLSNIGFTTRTELGKATGASSRQRAVFKVDPDGNEVEVYRSAREAGRRNHMSYQAVLDRCNGKVRNEYALDGYTYRFEEYGAGAPSEWRRAREE